MGQVGERLGPSLIEPDDFALTQPTYETMLRKKTVNGTNTEEASGSFSDLLNWSLIDDAEQNGVSNLYSVFGNHDAENWYVNDKVSRAHPDLQDSFGTPLVDYRRHVHEVQAEDKRKGSAPSILRARLQAGQRNRGPLHAMLREANYVSKNERGRGRIVAKGAWC